MMEHIKITRSEFFLYVKIIAGLGFVNLGFSISRELVEALVNPWFMGYVHPFYILTITFGAINMIAYFAASAWLLNKSETRKGTKDKFWLGLGILLGPLAVAGYLSWNLCKNYRTVLPEENEYQSVWQTLLQSARRD